MKKIIVLLLVVSGHMAYGKDAKTDVGAGRNSLMAHYLPIPSRDGGGSNVHFYYDIELGYASMSASGPVAFNDGNFTYGGDLGVRVNTPSKVASAADHVSLAVGIYAASFSNFKMSVVRFPVAYTHFWCFRNSDNAGPFWSLGITPVYVTAASDKGGTDISKHINPVFVEPSLYFGVHLPFTLVDRRTRNELGGGRVFVGPFMSYAFGNISKDKGETINPGYRVGLRWTYVF